MKPLRVLSVTLLCIFFYYAHAQESDKAASISLFTGAINYQGDLNPNSFTFKHSNFAAGITISKPLNRWFALRGGMNIGKIEAADKWNRDDLKSRNLSFTTSVKEVHLALEVSVLDFSTSRFTPYFYGGVALFHFNPWTYDKYGTKTYLKPLSTEGQGLPQFRDRKPYNLTQLALSFGGGAKFKVTDGFSIGIELNQRKSFTDYIDDVSSSYVDGAILQQEKGNKAVELAYRADEIPGGRTIFPDHGDQRGTPSEMDWYYFLGLTMEMKLNNLSGIFSIFRNNKAVAGQRCPRNINY